MLHELPVVHCLLLNVVRKWNGTNNERYKMVEHPGDAVFTQQGGHSITVRAIAPVQSAEVPIDSQSWL